MEHVSLLSQSQHDPGWTMYLLSLMEFLGVLLWFSGLQEKPTLVQDWLIEHV